MNTTSMIGHVVELHAAVAGSSHPADNVVREFLRSRHYLGSRERRFITSAVFGMLRNHRLIEERVRRASARVLPSGLPLSSITLYAAYAIVVEVQGLPALMADLGPLWATFLRDIEPGPALMALAEADPLADPRLKPEQRMGIAYSLPDFIVREWIDRYGERQAGALCAGLNQPAPTTLRVNTLRTTVGECFDVFSRAGVACRRTQLSPTGIVLQKRVNVQVLEPFRRGWFELQDEGSQLIGLLVAPPAGGFVVDACAGGGGKTLHLAALMGGSGRLAAIDVNERRLGNIRQRMNRAGTRIISLHAADREDFDSWKGTADAVLVDAPCTGVGTFRRNPGAKMAVTERVRDALAGTQRSVIRTYASLVRPGGRLVYSTCSLLRKENEDVVKDFLDAQPDFSPVSPGEVLRQQGVIIEGLGEFLELFPHRHGTDGFFAAVLQRVR
jgi:16S rRNA (cytosine967-C5)-methyltransferase